MMFEMMIMHAIFRKAWDLLATGVPKPGCPADGRITDTGEGIDYADPRPV